MRTHAALRSLALSSFLAAGLGGCSAPAPVPARPPTAAAAGAADGDAPVSPDARQILWQRDLEQALALARAEDRPLLLAVNMDGESASDRIVHENYRDPAFVADTRPFVCLVASVFRHNPVDHDDAGRRIPCPRLGEVTCGEHLTLEPALFEGLLADGDRVAPRHALVLTDGSKAWDLSLSFDLHDIDRALAASAAAERERRAGRAEPAAGSGDWASLAARRDARGRAALEERLAVVRDGPELAAALDALAAEGDAGAAEALRTLVARLAVLAPASRERLVACVRALGLEREVALQVRDRLRRLDPLPGAADPREAELLPLLATLDASEPSARALLLGAAALGGYGAHADAALGHLLTPAELGDLRLRLRAAGGPLDLRALLTAARAVTREAADPLPLPAPDRDAMPAAEVIEATLLELEERLADAPDDPELRARFAEACLDLGRRRLEAGTGGLQGLFEDAASGLAGALEERPSELEWWIERARAAYFLGRWRDQAEAGRRALVLAGVPDAARVSEPRALDEAAVEALRWIGDGDARLLLELAGTDAAAEGAVALEGLRALGLVAASPYGRAADWRTWASFAGALGLWREEYAIALAGLERYPAAPELRAYVNNALWNGGRFELAPLLADRLADEHPGLADAWWFAGQAWMLAAEDARRRELPELALDGYARSRPRLERVAELREDYAASSRFQLGLGWLGSGLAHARAGRRAEAADCLVAALAAGAPLVGVTDGLGYDVLDLVDKVCEWRETGPSPVDPLALARRIEKHAPGDPRWTIALSDSQLREALRADGRNPEREMRDTVDAEGNPIRMLLGLPNEEGDAYLRRSLALARRALPHVTSEEDRKSVAQADTIWAERNLERGRLQGVAEALREAAPLLGLEPPPEGADADALAAKAAELRAVLGEARPRWRLGR